MFSGYSASHSSKKSPTHRDREMEDRRYRRWEDDEFEVNEDDRCPRSAGSSSQDHHNRRRVEKERSRSRSPVRFDSRSRFTDDSNKPDSRNPLPETISNPKKNWSDSSSSDEEDFSSGSHFKAAHTGNLNPTYFKDSSAKSFSGNNSSIKFNSNSSIISTTERKDFPVKLSFGSAPKPSKPAPIGGISIKLGVSSSSVC